MPASMVKVNFNVLAVVPKTPGLKSWVMIGRDRSALCAVLESGLKSAASGHPCPNAYGPVKEGDVYDQMYRGSASSVTEVRSLRLKSLTVQGRECWGGRRG